MNLIRFYSILSNFCQILLQKNCFIIVKGDFNARATVWWRNNITTTEGTNIDSTASSYGLSQIICDAIHILSTSSSFIDLTFSNQANLVIENGIDLSLCLSLSHSLSLSFFLSLSLSFSLDNNCHHQIVYTNLNLEIEYPTVSSGIQKY